MFPFLSSKGVLGLNARNLLYIKPFNPRKAVAFADDKLKTKAYLSARGIPVARIYGKIESREQLRAFDFAQLPDECVLKPNEGFGGEGIIILKGRDDQGRFLEQGRRPIEERELSEHIEDILDGKFSVNGHMDTAFFEKILVPHECFAPFHPLGLPDIRIVVFNLVPVMAMLRVPTAQSGGKANVHLGGLGIGIDIANGTTTHAAQYHRIIQELPYGGIPSGLAIPRWDELLLIASRIQAITNIGYLAVDLTIDLEQGPVLLEVNARAGLMVQVANLAPLRARLERIGGLKVDTPEKGVRIAQDLFGTKRAPRRSASVADRPVLGLREVLQVAGDGVTVDVPCELRIGQEHTVFAHDLLAELLRQGAAETEDSPAGKVGAAGRTYRIRAQLGGRKFHTLVHEGQIDVPSVRAIIGRRDLKGFLVDPAKTAQASLVRHAVREDLRYIDRFIAQTDRDLTLLKALKPSNLEEERHALERDVHHNPLFQFPKIGRDFAEVESKLQEVSPEDSPLGLLLQKKRRELLLRLQILKSRGDALAFTEASQALFGAPDALLLGDARGVLAAREACDVPAKDEDFLSPDESVAFFREALDRYGLHDWHVVIRQAMVADCTVGAKRIFLRKGARFSRHHAESLVAHEIETHILTAENGEHQPFRLLRRGCANYLETQEGMAIVNQNRVLTQHHEKRFAPAKGVLAVAFALDHSFAQTRAYLQHELGFTAEKALTKTIDLKRGLSDTSLPGAFTKALVYFRGQRAVERFLSQGGDMRRLYVGKVAIEDLDLIEKIPGLRKPFLLPMFLREKAQEKVSSKKKKVADAMEEEKGE
jgi:alpha-L-glutamate ligase-like protein/uncharacterized protein (TIGR02421 family)